MHEHVRALKRRVITTLLGLGLVAGAGAAAISSLIDTMDVRHQQVAYQAAERLAAAELLASAQQARSSNARGYLLTGDPGFLEKRRSAREEFAAELDHLERLGGDEAQLRRLRALVTRLGESSDRALALWPEDAARAVRSWDQEVRPLQEQVAGHLYAYVSSARASSVAARSAAGDAAVQSRRLSMGLGGVMLAVLLALFLQFARTTRELLQRVRGEQEQVTFRLLDQVPFGIFVVDSRGAPYYANRSAERLLGTALLGAKAEDMAHVHGAYEAGTDHLYPAERTPIARALAGEASEVSDMELRREDQVIPLLVQGCPVYDQLGELTHAVAAFQDVRELTRKALVDALTGLSNRTALTQIFGRERLSSERSSKGLGVCIIDLDHFKAVNDQHGHAAGDRVLQRVARAISDALRRTDVVGRWGGEEFVVLLPGSDAHGLRTVLDRALAAVRRETFQGKDRGGFQVTFSAGAVLAHPGESLESSVARADALLYAAKRAGRNRIHVEAAPSAPPATAA